MIERVYGVDGLEKIHPDFIYNRVDKCSDNYILLHVENGWSDFYIVASLHGKFAELGSWMAQVSDLSLKEIARFLFKENPEIEYVFYRNTITDRPSMVKNHYHICLPNTYQELQGRISSKGRNTIKRKIKNIKMTFGSWSLVEYGSEVPDYIFQTYFRLKKMTHGIEYNMTGKEYVEKYYVSNVYVLSFADEIAAILFSCEQCPIAYLENLTYDTRFKEFSPGLIVYDLYLSSLIVKGKRELYLEGGDYDYKKRYGSMETMVGEGRIYRSLGIKLKYGLRSYYYRHLFWKMKRLNVIDKVLRMNF